MTAIPALDSASNGAAEPVKEQYGQLCCRICGADVFAPLPVPASADEQMHGVRFELTCPRGHTDSYDTASLQAIPAKPLQKLQARRAIAGIG